MSYTYSNNQYLPYNELIGLYNWEILGYSSEERPILSTSIGTGERKVCIWAGMHGNETRYSYYFGADQDVTIETS